MRCLSFIVLFVGACAQPVVDDGPGLAINVAPLTLDGVTEATYDITVKQGATIVWTRSGLTSSAYGDGHGSLAYVGPCDADGPNTIELTLVSLRAGTRELVHPTDYVNPTASGPIVRTGIVCNANADVRVDFNLTIARSANQGFFDVAVAFEDVFCSAKVDCRPELLLDDAGARGETAVVAFACTSGDLAQSYMYLSDVELVCRDADPNDATVLPEIRQLVTQADRDVGNQGAAAPLVYQWARYQQEESLPGLEKCFWNTAIGLDREAIGARMCSLRAVAHASETRLTAMQAPSDRVTPSLTFEVELIDQTGALCTNRALNAPGSGVGVVYSEAELPPIMQDLPFTAEHLCGEPATSFACDPSTNDVFEATADGVRVTIGGDSATFALPADASLSGCCPHACCGLPL